jgi:hypothetical protein
MAGYSAVRNHGVKTDAAALSSAGPGVEVSVPFLPAFEVVKQSVDVTTSKGQLVASTSYENLIRMIKLLLLGVNVDEAWYLEQYPDVAEAIATGRVGSAKQHFVDNGYFEGRLPFSVDVDEKWYQEEYPDVAESIRNGTESSAQAHFVRDGYREGRLPFTM